MKLWLIRFDGVYFGGHAVVLSETQGRALDLVRAEPSAFGAKNEEISELPMDVEKVLYLDDGDY